jgi:hypothetical protein
LERVFANYSRYFDAVVGDGLYFEAPFLNFCQGHHKDVVVVVKGDRRLLLQDAEGLFSHWRWDIENDCFNITSTHWGLDHVFKHEPMAIINFILTLFLAFTLLQCFWQRNLKAPFRDRKSPFRDRFTLIGLAAELYQGLVDSPCARARSP